MSLFARLIIRLFQLIFFSWNSIFLSQQISQQCFSAGLSAQPNGAYDLEQQAYIAISKPNKKNLISSKNRK
jgi:hypothetical protein